MSRKTNVLALLFTCALSCSMPCSAMIDFSKVNFQDPTVLNALLPTLIPGLDKMDPKMINAAKDIAVKFITAGKMPTVSEFTDIVKNISKSGVSITDLTKVLDGIKTSPIIPIALASLATTQGLNGININSYVDAALKAIPPLPATTTTLAGKDEAAMTSNDSSSALSACVLHASVVVTALLTQFFYYSL